MAPGDINGPGTVSTGYGLAMADYHLAHMWYPTPWDSVENAFDLTGEDAEHDADAFRTNKRLDAALDAVDNQSVAGEDDGAGVVPGGLSSARASVQDVSESAALLSSATCAS